MPQVRALASWASWSRLLVVRNHVMLLDGEGLVVLFVNVLRNMVEMLNKFDIFDMQIVQSILFHIVLSVENIGSILVEYNLTVKFRAFINVLSQTFLVLLINASDVGTPLNSSDTVFS